MVRGLSAIDIYVIVSEMQTLVGAYIDKIYQPTRDELLIKLNTKSSKETIYVKNSELVCLTSKTFTMPKQPSTFAMTCRKYITNGIITAITQQEFDRIVRIHIQKKEGIYQLVFELFKNGNILLINPDETIQLPLIKQQWSQRTLRSHEPYTPPPSQHHLLHLSKDQFFSLIKNSNKDLVRTLAVSVNLSGFYAEELCYQAQIPKTTKPKDLTDDQSATLYTSLQQLQQKLQTKAFSPLLVKKDDKIIDVLPFAVNHYLDADFESIPLFAEGLDQFISLPPPRDNIKQQEQVKKLQRQLDQQIKKLDDFTQKIQDKKREGDLLYLHFSALEALLQDITNTLSQKEKQDDIQRINEQPIVKHFDPTDQELIVILADEQGTPHDITIDYRKTVAENAQHAYQTGKKHQEKLRGAQEAIEITKQQLKKATVTQQRTTTLTHVQGKTYWFERYRWFISKEGNIIIAGKDAKSNEAIVKKYLTDQDRYVHADVHGAPSCIVKAQDIHDKPIDISDHTLKEACIFASSYSKAWNQFADAQAYWVYPNQVSKSPLSGEYLSKGAFIIRGKRNHYRIALELAIGEITLEGAKKMMAAPLESIKAQSQRYVHLKNGDIPKPTLAKQLATAFNTPIETIQKLLPPGKAIIIDAQGIHLTK